MTNYCDEIAEVFSIFPGIVEDPMVMEGINAMLNRLETSGQKGLVEVFLRQTNPDRARDFLFEVWVCDRLQHDLRITNLTYEPEEHARTPDFRFTIEDVVFDVQVKRLHNVKNEMTKLQFERECVRHLEPIPKPWFINFWVSDHFTPQHLNEFFSELKASINDLEVSADPAEAVRADRYRWEREGEILVRYSFMEKNSGKPGISIGIVDFVGTVDGYPEWLDTSVLRRAVRRQLRKAESSFQRPVSGTQSNLVILQAEGHLSLENDTMLDVLYGDDRTTLALASDGTYMQREHRAPGGLFSPGHYSRTCGVVLVPQGTSPLADDFSGVYFPNPTHLSVIHRHPKLFPDMGFLYPAEWRDGGRWRPAKVIRGKEPT